MNIRDVDEIIEEELVEQFYRLKNTQVKEVRIPFCTLKMVEDCERINLLLDYDTWSENSQDWSVRDISNTYFISGNKWNGGVQIQYIPDDEKDR